MWRMTTRLATAALFATLALIASNPSKADASSSAPVQSYSYTTWGNIAEVNGSTPITFNGMTGGSNTLTMPGTFNLGTFVTNALPASGTVTYNNTPFTIDLNVTDLHVPGQMYPDVMLYNSTYVIQGMLNGTYDGAGHTSMVASVTSITGANSGLAGTPPFPISELMVAPQGIVAPMGSKTGSTTLSAQVLAPTGIGLPSPAPEPTSVAAFAAVLVACALRRKFQSKRAA